MTVTYSDKSFIKLLPRWRGSIWKAICKNYVIWLICYYIINFSYRFGMDKDQQKEFDEVVNTFYKWQGNIPLTFLIGFYVSTVFARWWEQLGYVAWPDKVLLLITGNIPGNDAESRLIRRTFARHCNLLSILVWKEICVKIKKRFPTDDHLRRAGLMNDKEYELYQNTTGSYGRWFVPVSWMFNLLRTCREENRISDYAHQEIMREIFAFRGSSAMLTMFDWINVPLVYTQVVTLGTYGYFLICLLSRQSLIHREHTYDVDIYFPVFATLEFIFYIGWLKVGEELRCPFGEDDDDFDMNFILDRNIVVSDMLIGELNDQRPALEKDMWWEAKHPSLPHTKASYLVRDAVPPWRLSKYKVKPEEFDWYDITYESPKSKKKVDKTPAGEVKAKEMEDVELIDHSEPV